MASTEDFGEYDSDLDIDPSSVQEYHDADDTHSKVILDNFSTLDEVRDAIQKQGLETCDLIFGIDYTMSNRSQGKQTFGGKNLHAITEGVLNPYQKVICVLGETLESFDDDGIIPVFGFGDMITKDKDVFELKPGAVCEGFSDVLDAYNQVTPTIKLGGPTNFAPLIDKAIEIVNTTKKYHILVIVADGQVSENKPTQSAIIKASQYALSIIVVGVGDGPWGAMKTLDDGLKERLFDNFQFVDYHEVTQNASNPESAFALNALMEIPAQYLYLKKQGLVH